MPNAIIKLSKISKKYIVRRENPALIHKLFDKVQEKIVWAVRDVSLTIERGEEVGIIGANGAGKTTLLKIIAGITTPSSGNLDTRGKIVSLINLDGGFHPDLSGRDNLYLNAMLLGMNKREIEKESEKIIRFAEIQEFLDAPLYTYSDGMKLRLGFSVAIHTNPDILVIDESFSLGDQAFMEKTVARMKLLLSQGKTIIAASHDLDLIESNCSKVIWLKEGQIKKIGSARETVRLYIEGM